MRVPKFFKIFFKKVLTKLYRLDIMDTVPQSNTATEKKNYSQPKKEGRQRYKVGCATYIDN